MEDLHVMNGLRNLTLQIPGSVPVKDVEREPEEEEEKAFILDEELGEFFVPFQDHSNSAFATILQNLTNKQVSLESPTASIIERRAALDIGSGGTKLAIADVDKTTNKIVNMILEKSFPVPYQASLEKSHDGNFDETIKNLGLNSFKEINDLLSDYQVNKVRAVATAAFRSANNGEAFVKEIDEKAGIKINIISQQEEGNLAFISALAVINNQKPDHIVVWDIGTGSLQLTTLLENQDLTVFKGQLGSIPFRNYIIDVIQGKDSDKIMSPNPMTQEDYKLADRYARSLARKAFPVIKDKIQGEAMVIGLGRLFYASIAPLAGKDGIITRKGLRAFINGALNKTDNELNNPYAHVDVSNCILALAFMKALHIQQINVVDTTTSKGLLVAKNYWE